MAKTTNLSDKEVADLLMVSPVTVCEWVQRGMLHAKIDIGGHRLFGLQDVHFFAREQSISLSRPDRLEQRILIVDSDRGVSQSLLNLFDTSSETLDVQVVRNAFDAGRKMQVFRPDIVLLDFNMPHHDGFEICRRIKADPASHGVRVIAMTHVNDVAMKQRIMMAGAETCIPKPLSSREIFAAIGLGFEPQSVADSL